MTLACPSETRTKGIRVRKQVAKPKILRCAIYTRKSSEEGLEQDFNSLHAQRESCEAYIKSQKHEGWVALPVLQAITKFLISACTPALPEKMQSKNVWAH